MASPTFAAVLLVCLSGRVLSKIPLLVSLHPIFYSPHIVNSNNTNNRIEKKKKKKKKIINFYQNRKDVLNHACSFFSSKEKKLITVFLNCSFFCAAVCSCR
jgi:hypothetical protein